MATNLEKFMKGLREFESGGNYNAVSDPNPGGEGTAKGAYQYLDTTWDNHKGYRHANDAPKSVQDAKARADIGGFYKDYGRWDLVAIAWHAGPTKANQFKDNPSAITGGDINISTKKYVQNVLSAAGLKATSGKGGGDGGKGGSDRGGRDGDTRRRPWEIPRNVTGKGGRITVDVAELHRLSRNLTGHLAILESVRRRSAAVTDDLDRMVLDNKGDARRIREALDTALSDEYGVGRARNLLVRDIGYVIEARERALGADRTDRDHRRVVERVIASLSPASNMLATRRKVRRLLRGLYEPASSGSGRSGGGSGGGSGGSGGGVGARALAFAKKEIGVRETSTNYSRRIHVYQKTTGAYRQAWCASFVTWALQRAGKNVRGGGLAAVTNWVAMARRKEQGLRIVSPGDARPGDLVAYDWDGGADYAGSSHMGILATDVQGGRFQAVEGNISDAVLRKSRTVNTAPNTTFIRVG